METEWKKIIKDEKIISNLPPETHLLTAADHGKSSWTKTARIKATLQNGTQKEYFLKVLLPTHINPQTQVIHQQLTATPQLASGPPGLKILHGEYKSQLLLSKEIPSSTLHPITYGTLKSYPSTHFILSNFLTMSSLPSPEKLTPLLAKLHQATSKSGKYGFECPTYNGNLEQENTWCTTWSEYFTRDMSNMLDLEKKAHGNETLEMIELKRGVLTIVIPRLLKPLEGNIEPVLLHGDLWEGNVRIDEGTGEVVLFDAGAFYGHNEYDLRNMMGDNGPMGKEYLDAYHRIIPISKPEEDYEGRMALYGIMSRIHDSALYPHQRREILVKKMKEIVEKYAE